MPAIVHLPFTGTRRCLVTSRNGVFNYGIGNLQPKNFRERNLHLKRVPLCGWGKGKGGRLEGSGNKDERRGMNLGYSPSKFES